MLKVTEVARGAARFDELRPGWFLEIDKKNLSMVNPEQCILGQLYGNFWNNCEGVAAQLVPGTDGWMKVTIDHGLYVHTPYGSEDEINRYQTLADAWLSEIEERE